MLTTTMKDIHAAGPCAESWRKFREHRGLSAQDAKRDTAEVTLSEVLDVCGLDDALWVLHHVIQNGHIIRLFATDCAERVLPIFEKQRPDDDRPRKAIEVARNVNATDAERAAAWAAAWAAGDAAGAAAGAAWAARAAAWAAWAARAAGDAAEASAEASAGDAQKSRLRQYLEHGEAAASMPWTLQAA